MTTLSSGQISLSEIRDAFDGSGQISLGDLYQASGTGATNMLVRNVDSNDAIPDSGQISFDDFRGITANSPNAYELSSLLTSNSTRQYAISRSSFAAGMRTVSGTNDTDVQSHNYVNSTSVSGSNTFSSSLPNGIWDLVDGSTHIMMNYNAGSNTSTVVGYPDLTINGSGITEIDAIVCNVGYSSDSVRSLVKWSYYKSSSSNKNLAGLSVAATYSKSVVNRENRQMYFALPGSWSLTTNNSASGNSGGMTGTASYTAQKGDVIFILSYINTDNYVNHGTSASNSTLCIYSSSRWYTSSNVRMYVVHTAGSVTIDSNERYTSYAVFRKD
tara:strand:- start:4203 stop:5189 length:987 start_codon:yes stop_codon:yes gene_type:complete